MAIKINSIVRHINTNEVYEVTMIIGKMVMCLPINIPSIKGASVPFVIDELELLMEEESETFNLLFRDDNGK